MKILSNGNVVVLRQAKSENSSLPVAVHVSKTRVLKLPIKLLKVDGMESNTHILLLHQIHSVSATKGAIE